MLAIDHYEEALKHLQNTLTPRSYEPVSVTDFTKRHSIPDAFFLALRDLEAIYLDVTAEKGFERFMADERLKTVTVFEVFDQVKRIQSGGAPAFVPATPPEPIELPPMITLPPTKVYKEPEPVVAPVGLPPVIVTNQKTMRTRPGGKWVEQVNGDPKPKTRPAKRVGEKRKYTRKPKP